MFHCRIPLWQTLHNIQGIALIILSAPSLARCPAHVTVDLAAGKTWSDFNNLVYGGQFSTLIHLGNLDPDQSSRDFASFITIDNDAAANAPDDNSSPEPATLAVLGLGLAGLGLVSRRRRK